LAAGSDNLAGNRLLAAEDAIKTWIMNAHAKHIMDQFTKQAQTFAAVAAHSSEDSLRLLVENTDITGDDEVLDIACGPGIVACEMAHRARRVTGVDVVPAMLQQGKQRAAKLGLTNIEWKLGTAEDLRFPENRFSAVVARYSFHHLTDPGIAFREMVRVCRPRGRILVCDVAPDADKAAAYDQIELLRDPSHTHAMPIHELKSLAADSPVTLQREEEFLLAIPLEAQLAASFTAHADRIRDAITADVNHGRLGVNAEWRNGEIWCNLPISILIWRKA
jgi:ubiquinone/menaquinone biosynthesis C-methylase UbiE